MKIRGMGALWVTSAYDSSGSVQRTAISQAEYEVVTSVAVRQTLSVNCGGWSEALPKYRIVEQASFKVAEDDVAFPQALGFTEGSEMYVFLKRSGQVPDWDYLVRTIVKNVRRMVDAKKAVWVEILCQHGKYLRGVSAPVNVFFPASTFPSGSLI